MKNCSRIFLVGPMGAGKTTVGKRLAKALKRRFIDCDRELERRTGATIALIFELEGEAGFRQREKRLIEELTLVDDVVLATGGGAVLDADNRALLAQRGYTIYLHASLSNLLARTRSDVNRPLLNTEDRAARLQQIIATREPLYRETAHLSIDTGVHSLSVIVQLIREAVEE
jgi:shikimate kinase